MVITVYPFEIPFEPARLLRLLFLMAGLQLHFFLPVAYLLLSFVSGFGLPDVLPVFVFETESVSLSLRSKQGNYYFTIKKIGTHIAPEINIATRMTTESIFLFWLLFFLNRNTLFRKMMQVFFFPATIGFFDHHYFLNFLSHLIARSFRVAL